MEWYSPRASINSSAHCELCDTKECICEKNINHFIFRLVLLTRSYATGRKPVYAEYCGKAVTINYPSLENLFYFWIVSSLLLLYSICALAKKHHYSFVPIFFAIQRRPKRIGASSWAAKFAQSSLCVPVPVVPVVVVPCCTGQGMSLYSS